MFPLGIELPALIGDVGAVDALDTTLPVDGDEGTSIEPREELQSDHRSETPIHLRHPILAHDLAVDGATLVEDKTRLDVEPVEKHDVVEHAEVVVVEHVDVRIVEVERVAMFVVDDIGHCGVADAVAVTILDLCVSITLRVVGHTEGQFEEELLQLEVVT